MTVQEVVNAIERDRRLDTGISVLETRLPLAEIGCQRGQCGEVAACRAASSVVMLTSNIA